MANNKFGTKTHGREVQIKNKKFTYNSSKGVWEKSGGVEAISSSISTTNSITANSLTLTGGILTLSNKELSNAPDAYSLWLDANDSDAPASIGNYIGSNPLGVYVNGDNGTGGGTLGAGTVQLYHTGHFSGTHIANWQSAYSWGNHLDSNGALAVPSLTTTQISAISAPTTGSLVYNSTTGKVQYYSSGSWTTVGNKPPAFTTTAGSIATLYHSQRSSVSIAIGVSDPDSTILTYSISSGSLPAGLSINSSTGIISGTASAVTSDTTSTFTVQVADSDGASATRQFSITVKKPIVTTYNYTRTVQTFTVPSGVTKIYAAMWGAGGGGGNPGGQRGAGGGYTYGDIDVSSVSYLHVVVGQYGEGENNYFNTGNGNGCGGGLSGIFTTFNSDRTATYGRAVLVAGGGGGGGNNGGLPGTGGGTSGVAGTGGQGGGGGTQTAGGSTASSGGSCTSNCTAQQLRGANGCGGAEVDGGGSWPSMYWGGVWSAGAGGNGCNAGGGGGGYWGGGGGGGSPNGGQGGGGSGYIGGHSSAPVSNASTQSNSTNQAPAGTGNTYYPGNNIGYGASAAELDGYNGAVVIVY